MKIGTILKGIGGYYTVQYEGNKQCVLRPRGKFRHKEERPLPGDRVRFDVPPPGTEGFFEEILQRKNQMLRPAVANVDEVWAVICMQKPAGDFLLLDKLLANCRRESIPVRAVLNKCDLASEEQKQRFLKSYCRYSPLLVSTHTGEGIEALTNAFLRKIICLSGQSGVGKTSITNALLPGTSYETGELSKKTSRGRHTTRHAELLCGPHGSMIVDTPGFSLMDLPLMAPEMLRDLYPEYDDYANRCKFDMCVHQNEPGCAVKQAVEQGSIDTDRYHRYLQILQQVQEKWRKRYE